MILPPIIAGTLTTFSSFLLLFSGGMFRALLLSAILGSLTMLAVAMLGAVIRLRAESRLHQPLAERIRSDARQWHR